jgi:hypothetical protein
MKPGFLQSCGHASTRQQANTERDASAASATADATRPAHHGKVRRRQSGTAGSPALVRCKRMLGRSVRYVFQANPAARPQVCTRLCHALEELRDDFESD